MPVTLPAALHRLRDAAADLTLGSGCPGCRTPGWGLCEACRRQLPSGAHLVERPGWTQMPPVAACGWYREPLSSIVIAHKDDGAWQLAGLLGGLLGQAVGGLNPAECAHVLLVPVPSDPAAVRRRGYDHSSALAKAAGRRLGLGVRPLLQRARAAADQVGRGRDDRLRAQQGTMVGAAGASAALIVTDDVVTTGSTMSEAVRALRAAGYLVRGAAVVCDTPRWATPR